MKKTIFILTLLLPTCFLFAQNNVSDVNTDGDLNAPSFVSQSGEGWNYSFVDQDQDQNTVEVTQLNDVYISVWWFDRNNSNIKQDGIDNHAEVDQIHGTSPTDAPWGGNLDADIDQLGSWNAAYVRQEGTWNFATTLQEGDNGIARQYQGKGNNYTVLTPTRFNDADIHQGSSVDGGSRAEQYQEGTQNDAEIFQNSWDGSRAVQIQVNDRALYTYPIFTNLNVAVIDQYEGGDNRAYQVQYYNVASAGQNDAYTEQYGSGNRSKEVQFGGENQSDVHQDGTGNGVKVVQFNNGVIDPGLTLPISY